MHSVKCQNQLEMSTLIYVFGQIAKIASRCGVYIFRMRYNLLPWYMYIHDFQCKFCNGPILNDNVGLFFLYHLLTGCNLWTKRGPNPFWSSIRPNSISFSRNMCTCLWNIGKFEDVSCEKAAEKKIFWTNCVHIAKHFFVCGKKGLARAMLLLKLINFPP